jgi:hypothetical protein
LADPLVARAGDTTASGENENMRRYQRGRKRLFAAARTRDHGLPNTLVGLASSPGHCGTPSRVTCSIRDTLTRWALRDSAAQGGVIDRRSISQMPLAGSAFGTTAAARWEAPEVGRLRFVTDGAAFGRRLRARASSAGAAAALDRAVPLAPGEQVLLRGGMRLHGTRLLPRPVLLRLTAPRLVVLAHFAFRPDQVWELPRPAIRHVELFKGTLRITWSDQAGAVTVLQLAGWTGGRVLDRPIRDPQDASRELSSWLDGRTG